MNIHAPKGGTLWFLLAMLCVYAAIVLFVLAASPTPP